MGMEWDMLDMLLLEDEDELPMSMLDISWSILGWMCAPVLREIVFEGRPVGIVLEVGRVEFDEGCRICRGKMSRSLYLRESDGKVYWQE
jgi:hypothetical protein